jgi:hypothetical protein
MRWQGRQRAPSSFVLPICALHEGPVAGPAQDVYRRLTEPAALAGLLRLRASPELRAARAYGPLTPDGRYENLYHVTACGPRTAFAFDLEYAGGAGLSAERGAAPFLQMVFQYSCIAPAAAGAAHAADSGGEQAADGSSAAQPSQSRCLHISPFHQAVS